MLGLPCTYLDKAGREGDREFFLESWNGDSPFTMDRIGRGTTSEDGVCLSVLGGLQPAKFENYVASLVKGGKSDDGLLQRFQILLYPERRKTWVKVDREPNEAATKTLQRIVEAIDKIALPVRTEEGIKRIKLRYDEDAQYKDYDKPRDLYRKRWKGLASAEDFDAAISTLSEYGWLRLENLNVDGKNLEVIRLHLSFRL